MSGTYLYCQNPDCGVYLGSLGGDDCHICGWKNYREEDEGGQHGTDTRADS